MTREDSLLVQIQVKKPILVDVTNQLLDHMFNRKWFHQPILQITS